MKIRFLRWHNPLFFVMLLLGISCDTKKEDYLTAEEREWLESKEGELEVLFGYEAPPNAFYSDEGDYEGVLVDFLHEIENESDINFKFHNFDAWSELLEYSKVNNNFIIVGIAKSESRSRYLSFTDALSKTPYVIIARADSPIKSINDLKNKKVCTAKNYAINDFLAQHYSFIKPYPVIDNLEGVRGVSSKIFDAMIVNQMYAAHIIEYQGLSNLKVVGEIGYMNRLCAATSNSDNVLFEILDKTVDQIDKVRRREIYRKWLHINDSIISERVASILLIGALAILVLLFFFWLWLSSLTKQVKKKTKEILKAKEKAEESDRLKSAFLANMSHEIRTPMNGILGFTDLLKQQMLDGEVGFEYIDVIQQSGKRMLNTINEIIEISKIETGQILPNYSLINVKEQLDYFYMFFLPDAEQKGLELILKEEEKYKDEKYVLMSDKKIFQSIISNLINNAIKYTNEGVIEIGCEKDEREFTFSVKDSGVGISKDKLTSIFNRFEQVASDNNYVAQGVGLGLAICKSYVEILGGKICVESEKDKGSAFYFSLPVIQNAN